MSQSPHDVLHGARVVVVDGNGLSRTLTRRALEEAGVLVTVAADGVGALAALRRARAQLLVTGRELGGLGGVALVRAVRRDPALAGLHVVVLTSTEHPEAIVEALEAGADDHLLKPFHAAELVARVRAGMRLVVAREDLRRQRDAVTGLMNAIRDGLVVSDRAGHIHRVNARMEEMVGRAAADLVGRGAPHPFTDARTARRILEALERLAEGPGAEIDVELVRSDGTRFPAVIALSRHPGDAGPGGDAAIWLVKDLTDRRRAEARLRESELRFATAADAAPMMLFTCDPQMRATFLNAEMRDFLGVAQVDAEHPLDRRHLVHPDDQAALGELPGAPGETLRAEVRLRHRTGQWRWVSITARPRPDDAGGPGGYIGTAIDVTEVRTARQEKEVLHALTGMVAAQRPPDAVFARVASAVGLLLDADAGGVVRSEGGVARIVGSWARVPELRRDVGTVIPRDDRGVTARVLDSGRTARVDDYGPGSEGRRSSVGAPVVVDGRVWGVIGAVHRHAHALPHDAEERLSRFAEVVGLAIANAEARDRLAHLAATDALTGLPNRRSFDAQIAREIAGARRDLTPLSLAVADIDHFKAVNDTHGHDAGDRVLVEIARILDAAVRTEDPVARFGGEEFVWLMPGAAAEAATAVAERVRRTVADARIAGVGPLTVSVGVATMRPDESAEGLFKAADDALFVAKQSGRDRVVHADALALAGVLAIPR